MALLLQRKRYPLFAIGIKEVRGKTNIALAAIRFEDCSFYYYLEDLLPNGIQHFQNQRKLVQHHFFANCYFLNACIFN